MTQRTQRLLFSIGIVLVVVTHIHTGTAAPNEADMIRIPAGAFTMGSDTRARNNEKPAHKVYLDAYYIGKYEVTNEAYYQFWQATGKHTPESFPDDYGIGAWPQRALKFPRHPVVGVSWYDAVAYAEWADMRLPTEAEWEKAVRGPTDRRWPWGNSPQPYANTWDGKDGYDNGLAPVGSFPKGKSYYGVMDMAGNVWEWTADRSSATYYTYSPKRNPKGPETGSWRTIRGGSWMDDINWCGTTLRAVFYPGLKTSFIGFRLARTALDSPSTEKSKTQSTDSVPQK